MKIQDRKIRRVKTLLPVPKRCRWFRKGGVCSGSQFFRWYLLAGALLLVVQNLMAASLPYVQFRKEYEVVSGKDIVLQPEKISSFDRVEWKVDGVVQSETTSQLTLTGVKKEVQVSLEVWIGETSAKADCRVVFVKFRTFSGGSGDGGAESVLKEDVNPAGVSFRIWGGGLADGFGESALDPDIDPSISVLRVFSGGQADGFGESALEPDIDLSTSVLRVLSGGQGDGFDESDLKPDPDLTETEMRLTFGGSEDGFTESALNPDPDFTDIPLRKIAGGKADGYDASCERPTVLSCIMEPTVCVGVKITAEASDEKATFLWTKYNEQTETFEKVAARTGISGITSSVFTIDARTEADYGLYQCKVSNACGDGYSEVFSVSPDGLPEFRSRLNQDWSQCEYGEPVDMGVIVYGANLENKITYAWYKDGVLMKGKTEAGMTIPVTTQAATQGWYKVVVSNNCGQIADSTFLPVWEKVRIVNYQQNITACEGGQAAFDIEVSEENNVEIALWEVEVTGGSSTNPEYKWKNVVGWGSRVVLNVDASWNDRTYVWKVHNRCGDEVSRVVRLKVLSPPRIVASTLSPQKVCEGERLELSCETAQTSSSYIYRWYKNDVLYSTEGARLVIPSVGENHVGIYRCEVSNPGCSDAVSTPDIRVEWRDRPELNRTIRVDNPDFCIGRKVTLSADIFKVEFLSRIEWRKNGRLLNESERVSGVNTSYLHIDSIVGGDEGYYQLRAYGECGSVATDSFYLQVDYPATFVKGLNEYVNMEVCTGDSKTIRVETEGTLPIMYMWTKNNEKVAEGYTSTLRLDVTEVDTGGVYCCEIHNKCAQSYVECAPIHVINPDTFRLTGPERYCKGDSAGVVLQLTGSDSNNLYRLYRNDVVFRQVKADTVVPREGPLVFANLYEGYYYVEAEERGCVKRMPGEIRVKEDSLPKLYRLWISRHYCEGSSGAELTLSGSQVSVLYQLYKQEDGWIEYGAVRSGIGTSLVWTDLQEGIYKVVAVNALSGCVAEMEGMPEVIRRPVPREVRLFAENDRTEYCAGAEGVTLQLSGYEPECIYSLWRGNTGVASLSGAPYEWEKQKAGIYKVKAENLWGCQIEWKSLEITERAAPAVYALTGGGGYCEGEEKTFPVILKNSDPDVLYYFYREGSELPEAVKRGTGDSLQIEVGAVEAGYYVVAEDVSPERCRIPMPAVVKVEQSRLSVEGTPQELSVPYETKATLQVKVSGAKAVNYEWTPVALLETNGASSVQTVPLTEAHIFYAEVRDSNNCKVQTALTVTVNGGPLSVAVLDENYADADRVYVCSNAGLNLYALYSGGVEGDNWSVSWKENGVEVGSGQWLKNYGKQASGYIRCEVIRGHLIAADSVWIEVMPAATAYGVEYPGLRCTKESQEEIHLANSETGSRYFLEYSENCNTLYQALGNIQEGRNGTPLTFSLATLPENTGCYRVVAERSYSERKCRTIMEGSVEIRPYPVDFEVSGDNIYCEGEVIKDQIRLSGSETGYRYELFREKSFLTSLSGTGNPLVFEGRFGTGIYKIRALSGRCVSEMKDTVVIREKLKPRLYEFENQEFYCGKDCPVKIALKSGEEDVSYTLYRLADGIAQPWKTITEDTLVFGEYCEAGTYYVKAEREGCVSYFTDTVRIGTPASVFNITGENTYCYTEAGVIIGLNGSEPGRKYMLQRRNERAGRFESLLTTFAEGNGYALQFSGVYGAGAYRVVTDCGEVMGEVLEVRRKAPVQVDLNVRTEENACVDSTVILRFMTEENAVYSLWKEDVKVSGEEVTGDGNEATFTIARAAEGMYKIKVWKEGCEVWATGVLEVRPLPEVPVLSGETEICEGTGGNIWVENYQSGLLYQLRDTVNGGTLFSGTQKEGKYVFTNLPAGVYEVEVKDGQCRNIRSDYRIKAIALPVLPEDILTAASCVEGSTGTVWLKGLSDTLIYTVITPSFTKEIVDANGEAEWNNQPLGLYQISAQSKTTGCVSLTVSDTLLQGPGLATLIGDTVYCGRQGGVYLGLSACEANVEYSLCTTDGGKYETIKAPALNFKWKYKEGLYIFRKKRIGVGGGCVTQDTFSIRGIEEPMPIDIRVSGAPLCSGGGHVVSLATSQAGVTYICSQQGTGLADTVIGNGGEITFSRPLNEIGYYKITAVTERGCSTLMDTVIQVHKRPEAVRIAAGTYCYDPLEALPDEGADVVLEGIQTGVKYMLMDSEGQNKGTVSWPLERFAAQKAGVYRVVAQDLYTGCQTVSDEVKVMRKLKPRKLKLENACVSSAEVKMQEATEGDSVIYYLFRGTEQLQVKTGTGGMLTFGNYTEPGIYKIKAEKNNGCVAWMADSVYLFREFRECPLVSVGEPCNNGSFGTTLLYECSTEGWSYYVTDGTSVSDTLQGTGGSLQWNVLDKDSILPGTYSLYTFTGCMSKKSGEIVLPGQEYVVPQIEGDSFFCTNRENQTDLYIHNSESDVTYQLWKYPDLYYPQVRGTGGKIQLNDVPLTKIGEYRILAKRDGSRCENVIGVHRINWGELPKLKYVLGRDVCTSEGNAAQISICMDAPQPDIRYVLYLETDVLTEKARISGGSTCFPPQTEIGVYKVIAEHEINGCTRPMTGQYAIGERPLEYELVNAGTTIRMCAGTDTVVRLNGSDIGVKYYLKKDGQSYGNSVAGTGGPLLFAPVSEAGLYTIVAENGCTVSMRGNIRVITDALPDVQLKEAYYYCEGEIGTSVEMFASSPSFHYALYTDEMVLLQEKPGNGDTLRIGGGCPQGTYYVRVEDRSVGCYRDTLVQVIEDTYPLPFDLYSSAGKYICPGVNETALRLDGSEEETGYYLTLEGNSSSVYRKGTGSSLWLGNVTEMGKYEVVGEKIASGCRAFIDTLTIVRADTIFRETVISDKAYYCYSDLTKGRVQLSGSKTGILYELFLEGESKGDTLWGNGNALQWDSLTGKACRDCVNEADGMEYTVWATDTLTGCRRQMKGSVKLVEEENVVLRQFHPNRDFFICQGQATEFTVLAVGCNLKYNWFFKDKEGNEHLFKGADRLNEPYHRIDSATTGDYGLYWCEVGNTCDTVPTPQVLVDVREAVYQPKKMEDVHLCESDLHPVVLNSGIIYAKNYEWYELGVDTARYLTESLVIAEPKETAYVCHAWDECNNLYDTCHIIIDSMPVLDILQGGKDTLCIGNGRQLKINTEAAITWLKDGVEITGLDSNTLVLDSLKVENAGHYSVTLENACGTATYTVADIWVDEPVELIRQAPAIEPVICEGKDLTLYVETKPTQRIHYEWRYREEVIGREMSVTLPSVDSTRSVAPYKVYFGNACNKNEEGIYTPDSAEFRLKFHPQIIYQDPERQIIACADPSRDTLLRVMHPASQVVDYRWYYYSYQKDTMELFPYADTLRIPLRTDRTGYYFCRLENACGIIATNSCLLRVDTVPLLKTNLQPDTLCEGETLRMQAGAIGGSVSYCWLCKKKNGLTDTLSCHSTVDFESTDELVYRGVTMEQDSSLIWCCASNGCGEAWSDTVLLRVRPQSHVILEPDTLRFCAGETGTAVVKLVRGVAPWSYRYALDEGTETEIKNLTALSDTLKLTEPGEYKITAYEDAGQCRDTLNLPALVVINKYPPEIYFTGDSVYCQGEEAEVRLRMRGARGPWKVTILRDSDSEEATEIYPQYPLVICGNDTTLHFVATSTETYYLYRVETGECGADLKANRVKVEVNEAPHIDFIASWPSSIGQCENVDLRNLLKPAVNGVPFEKGSGGMFYINGQLMEGDGWTKKDLLPGCYRIKYEHRDIKGCVLSSDEIGICVDTLPSAQIVLPELACQGYASMVEFRLLPAAQDFKLRFRQTVHKKNGFGTRSNVKEATIPASDLGVYQDVVNWNMLDAPDSCTIYEILDVTDSHGCGIPWEKLPEEERAAYRDTIWWHTFPEFRFSVRYPHTAEWKENCYSVNVTQGDSVEVKIELIQGDAPWSIPGIGARHMTRRDTIVKLGKGKYTLRAVNDDCGLLGWEEKQIIVTEMERGYFRGRLWLEGPYDQANHRMVTSQRVKDCLNFPVLSSLPEGIEIIDWIEVELRTGSPRDSVALMGAGTTVVTTDSCLLLSNGYLADRYTGDTLVGIKNAIGGGFNNYYVVVRHRNHLDVMGSRICHFVDNKDSNVSMIDFTRGNELYCRDGHLEHHVSKTSWNGKVEYMLSAGELNNNLFITLFDPNRIPLEDTGETIIANYDLLHDINFDGKVEWPGWGGDKETADWNIIKQNRQKFSEIK